MLLQLRHLARRNADTSFLNIYRHYARAVANARRKEKATTDTTSQKNGIPIIVCKKKMFNFYKGDRFTNKTSELASHQWKHRTTKDDHFCIYPYNVGDIQGNDESDIETFRELQFNPTLCDNLESLGVEKPLQIQQLGIPKIMEGYNTLLAAETGCGKTIAYLLPLIMKILKWKEITQRKLNTPLGLIVTPSRELAVQIALELIKLSRHLNIKTKMITGGRTKKLILDPPVGQVDVLVCSFGVISKLSTLGVYNLQSVRFVVLDEADALFHHTFEDKLRVFMKRLSIGHYQVPSENEFPSTSQLILTSATIPSRLETVLDDVVDPRSVEHVTTEKLHKILVPQKFMRLIPSQKPVELLKYIKPKALKKQRTIVFSNNNGTSYWLAKFLNECGIKCTNLNGDMSLHERRGKYGEFINGKTTVLSTTNGGSRGLDTVMVNHILNYDFPLDTADYIHRCGRTGRVGTVGDSRVTNFISRQGEAIVVQKIERASRKMQPIPIFNLTQSADEEEEAETQKAYAEPMIYDLDKAENIPY